MFLILKKELDRVFGDKKLIFSLFILPIILMVGIYSLMGIMVENMEEDITTHKSSLYIQNAPDEFKAILDTFDFDIEYVNSDNNNLSQEISDKILNATLDIAILFDVDFLEQINNYTMGSQIPDVRTFYNPSEDYSSQAKSIITEVLESYRLSLLEKRTGDLSSIQIFTVDKSDEGNIIQDEQKASAKTVAMILPYLISMLLFAGAMSLGNDMIAGEKERGTMASMLVSPIKRSSIVYGKLFALMILSGLSALVYLISLIVSMPLMGKSFSNSGINFSLNISQIIMLTLIIITLVFVYVALISVTSVLAKDLKTASTYVMPAYIIVIVCGMMTMFVTGETQTSQYLIPIYGSSMALRNIITQDITMLQCLISTLSNIVVGGILAFVVTKAFNNEKIMFNA